MAVTNSTYSYGPLLEESLSEMWGSSSKPVLEVEKPISSTNWVNTFGIFLFLTLFGAGLYGLLSLISMLL